MTLSRVLAVALSNCFAISSVLAQEINDRALGEAYAHLISFEAEPEIAAAWFSIDSDDDAVSDADLSTTKLPLYREFEADGRDWRWFVQGALSYMTYEESLYIKRPDGGRESLTPEWTGYGGLLEGGMIFPLGRGFSVAPSLGLGISRLENEMKFSDPVLEGALPPDWKGSFYGWDTLASVARAHVGLLYDEEYGKLRVKGGVHLSYSYIDSFDESDSFAGFHDHSSTFVAKLDVSHPLNLSVRKNPLRIIGHIGNTSFLGSGRDELDFSYFNELGLSLGWKSFAVGVLGIVGEDVEGWSLVFNYDY